MRRVRWLACLLAATAVLSTLPHARAAGPGPATLPLRSVRLYETGVGYFERSGSISRGGGVTLPVPAGHLDDALKTLVVLGEDGNTTVSGIEFASSTTRDRARALAGLPAGTEERITYHQLLQSLKGANVEVRTSNAVQHGTLVDVLLASESDIESCRLPSPTATTPTSGDTTGCRPERHMTLLLVTDRGEVRRFRAGDIVSVRPSDPSALSRLDTGLDAVSVRGAQTQRTVNVLATSTGPVTLGYIAETPVWRSTYRMVLASDRERCVLQGWALLHNDTDEDWRKVRVELVNGQPTSFLFPLAAPRYARRELVTPEVELSTVPQLQDTTVDNLWRGETADAYGAGGLGLSGTGSGGGGRGESIGLGSIGTIGHGAGTGLGASSLISVGNLANVAKTDAVESGTLFRYSLQAPIDLRAHGSALVPFMQESVQARRVAFLSAPGATARAAVHFKNDTKQTVPAGTVAVYADGGFAGESAIDRLKPQESRIIPFGVDLDLELTQQRDQVTDTTRVVVFAHDTLVEHFVRHHDIRYEIVNRSGSPRTVYLTLGFVQNAKVEGADELTYDEDGGKAVAVFEVEAKKQPSRDMKVDEGLQRGEAFERLTANRLQSLARAPALSKPQRASLQLAYEHMLASEARAASIPDQVKRKVELEASLPRLRANLSAVARSSDASAKSFAARIVDIERRIQDIEARTRQLRADALHRRKLAHEALEELTTSRTR